MLQGQIVVVRRKPARRECNSFENDSVAYWAGIRRRAGIFGNDQIVCLINRRDVMLV